MLTLEDFYSVPSRRQSREIEFGSSWRSSKWSGYEFRVFWVAETNELCTLRTPVLDIQSDGPFSRFVVGMPPHTRTRPLEPNEAVVEILDEFTEQDLDVLLDGWEKHSETPDGYEWILRRASDFYSAG